MICMYCRRARAAALGREGVRCAPCAAYIDRLLASDDERAKVYGWLLVLRASVRHERLYPARKAA